MVLGWKTHRTPACNTHPQGGTGTTGFWCCCWMLPGLGTACLLPATPTPYLPATLQTAITQWTSACEHSGLTTGRPLVLDWKRKPWEPACLHQCTFATLVPPKPTPYLSQPVGQAEDHLIIQLTGAAAGRGTSDHSVVVVRQAFKLCQTRPNRDQWAGRLFLDL